MHLLLHQVLNKDVFDEELYSNLNTDQMSVNQFDNDKLQLPHKIGRGDKVMRVPFHLYGRYRISGMVGMVKRNSNLDKQIEGYFKAVIDRDNANRLKNAQRYKNTNETSTGNKRPSFVKEENQVVPGEVRDLFEELIKGKPVELEGKKYKLVEENSVTEQLDKMLRETE